MAGKALLKPIAQKVVQTIPQLAAKALSIFSGNSMRVVQEATEAVASVASTSGTVADSGVWQVVGKVRRGLSDDLQNLLHTIDATAEQKGLFDKISSILRERDACLSDADRNSLMDVLTQLSQGKNPGEVILNPAQKIEQLKGQVTQLTEQADSTKNPNAINNREITGDPTKDADTLIDSALTMLTNEIIKEDSIPCLLWDMGIMKPEDAPDNPKELPGYLKKKVLGENAQGFKDCVTQYLWHLKGNGEAPDPDAHNLNPMQKKAFNALRCSRWAAQWIPSNVRKFLGKFKLIIAPVLGFLDKIPVIGGLARIVVPFFNEYIIGFLVFHGNNAAALQTIAEKYKPDNKNP